VSDRTAKRGIGGAEKVITIHGTPTSEDEYEAAQALRASFIRELTGLEDHLTHRIDIVVSAKTPKHRRIKDIDLVLLGRFDPPVEVLATLPEHGTQTVRVYSFACTIEVKNDRAEDIRVRDNKLETRYKNEWTDDAWEQADLQKFALQSQCDTYCPRTETYGSGRSWPGYFD
jgi:hypothetical protein